MKRLSNKSRTFIRGFVCIAIILVGLNMLPIRNTHSAISSRDSKASLSLTPHDPIYISSDIELEVFPGSGTEFDPYVIEGYSIVTTEDYGIYIAFTTQNFTVRNCYVFANNYGIFINQVNDSTATVVNNTCNNNYEGGIYIGDTGSSTVINNTCRYNYFRGIILSYSDTTLVNNTCNYNGVGIELFNSVSSTVTNNTCSNNSMGGIELSGSGSSTVENNTCNNNKMGIWISSSGSSKVANNTCNNINYGIYIDYSSSSTVENNTCNNNDIDGILIADSDFCIVTYNLLQENDGFGINIAPGSDNNVIHHNTFVDNYLIGTAQAFDDGTTNTWYEIAILEGNYWSDWSGTGSYAILGSAEAVDPYPLGEPTIPPVVPEFSNNINVLILVFVFGLAIIPLSLISRKRLNNK